MTKRGQMIASCLAVYGKLSHITYLFSQLKKGIIEVFQYRKKNVVMSTFKIVIFSLLIAAVCYVPLRID